jgi:hypothetical protein
VRVEAWFAIAARASPRSTSTLDPEHMLRFESYWDNSIIRLTIAFSNLNMRELFAKNLSAHAFPVSSRAP